MNSLLTYIFKKKFKKKWSISLYNCFYGINIPIPTILINNWESGHGIFNGKGITYVLK